MKVLHIIPTYFPAVRYGGPIQSVHALCRNLAASGDEIDVFTTSVDGPVDSKVHHEAPVFLDGVRVHYFRSRHLRRLFYSAALRRSLKHQSGTYDLMHLHSVFLWPTWAGARSAVRAGVPYVLSPRGMLVPDLIERRSRGLKRAWIDIIERRNLSNAAVLHVTSWEEKRALEQLKLALAPTCVIPNGVEAPEAFSPDAVSADVRAAIAEGYDVLSFGRINWKKGLDRLIQAMAEIPTAKAVVAGNDEDGDVPRLREMARRYKIGARIRFIPRQIGGADREALFGAARVFVLPSLSENFGNVVAEAMIRRLPVVVTEGVGAGEVVVASGGGLVSQNSVEAFAAALRTLLAEPDRMDAMAVAGESYAREHLSWAAIARRFAELYRETCARTGPHAKASA